MHTPKLFLLTGVFLLLLHTVCTGQEARDTNNNRSEPMDQNNEYIPSVESLTPYQSAADYFKTRLGEDETIKLVFTINSPAESYATMIKRTLEENPEYDITITMTPRYKPGTRKAESWHLHGISKELRVGKMTAEKHHAVTGWVYDVAGYFNSSLRTLNYRI